MSKQKNKNSLLSNHSRASPTSVARDELMAMKFVMEKPQLPIYPLGDKLPQIYPDFYPWDEPDLKNEKLNNSNYLNKGYFENPLVSNEYFSARNLIQETLFLSSANCTKLLNELSLNLTKAFRTRNEVINRISLLSATFKLPPRVTLTALKREAWLKDLANPEIPLLQVCSKIPHGIRNKVLIECMCNLNVPITRAIWFTKCVLHSEQLLIRKKLLLKVSSAKISTAIEIMEARWILEWTLHVADYLLKFSRDLDSVSSVERKTQFQQKLNYLLSFVKTLYIECLLDKTAFLSATINFLREDQPFLQDDLLFLLELSRTDSDDTDTSAKSIFSKLKPLSYGQTLLGLNLIKVFWTDILAEDFLCKAANEALLLNYFFIDKSAAVELLAAQRSQDLPLGIPLELKQNILQLISSSIVSMFRHNSNVFIVPEFWILIGDVLYRILMNDESMADQKENIENTLKLISYRNESLMLNMKYSFKRKKSVIPLRSSKAVRKNSFLLPAVQSGRLQNVMTQPIESDFTCFGGSKKDILRFINQLDRNKFNNFITASLTPRRTNEKGSNHWKLCLKVSIYWCVTEYRDMGPSSVRILTFCNFLKRKVQHGITGRGSSQLKAELENEILESFFSLASEERSTINMRNLYVLINELYQLKVITISSYLRKLIACGIFYVSPENSKELEQCLMDPTISFHISILQNLPVLNNKQCDHILKKWTEDGSNFTVNFNKGIELAQKYVVEGILNNSFAEDYDSFLSEIDALEMGVKFLVVNWLTTQIKTTISKSPKLIHLSPLAIANIYRFYEKTDNLAVFLRVLIKFVLKNEDKIIIFYLETLYFICKLLVHHFPLIKLMAGQNYDASSAASELFKLVLLSYKDILSRETDIYRFQEIWDFIAKSMEKPSTLEKSGKESGLRSLLFGKETADSPLSIQTHAFRRKDFYSPEEFHSDLNGFLTGEPLFLTDEEMKDCFREINMAPDSANKLFLDASGSEHAVLTLLNSWFLKVSYSESEDLSYFKLIEQLRKKIKLSMGDDFYSAISSFVMSRPEHNCDSNKVATFLRKLLSFELFLIMDLLTIIENFVQKQHESYWRNLTSQLLFGGPDYSLLLNQTLMYELLLNEYKANNMEHLFGYAILDLKSRTDENESLSSNGQMQAIMNNLIMNQRVSSETLFKELGPRKFLDVCNLLVGATKPIDKLSQLSEAIEMPNEFCLSVWQLLLHVLIAEQQPSKEEVGSAALQIITKSKFLFGLSNSFFSELFDQINWEYRLELFYFFEDSFFNYCYFSDVTDGSESESQLVLLRIPSSLGDLLPVFKDFFKKFSCPSIERIETLQVIMKHISQFLQKLVNVLDSESVQNLSDVSIYTTVSIFLRLLIIHNANVAEQAGRSKYIDIEFFQNLVTLLNSEYLKNGHEKLHILLYDLLLMMKSTLTQILSAVPSESLLETLPESSNETDMEPQRGYDGNATSTIIGILGILNLPEPKTSVFSWAQGFEPECIATLDDEELNHTSDICIVNNKKLEISHAQGESLNISSPFGVPKDKPKKVFNMKSVALIENPSDGVNNGCFNLALFDAYTTKENPL